MAPYTIGKIQARPSLAFSSEKRLEATPPGVFVHADAGVSDLDVRRCPVPICPVASALVRSVSVPPSGIASSALKIRIGHCLANFAFDSGNRGEARREFDSQMNHEPALLGHIAPAGPRGVQDLLHEAAQIDRCKRQLRFVAAVKFAHPRHGLRNVADGALDVSRSCAPVH